MIAKKRILHIFERAIITQSTIELFEKLDYEQYYIILDSNIEQWSEMKARVKNIRLIAPQRKDVVDILKQEISKSDIIIAQALSVEKAKAIYQNKDKKKVFIWALWGYELYNYVSFLRKNDSIDFKTTSSKQSLVTKLKEHYIFKVIYSRAVKKIDICLFLLKEDFDILKEVNNTKAIWRSTCYQTIDNLLAGDEAFKVQGDSILIGNSSTPSNRHEVILDQLKTIPHLHRKMIIPLNYGDDSYRKTILSKGKKIFGEQIEGLVDFMPLEDYTTKIKSCSHVIMGHIRQQAFGTIMMMLYGGAKLYLSELSPLYTWLKELKLFIYSIEHELTTELSIDLTEEQKESNRSIIKDYLSESSILRQIDSVLEEAIEISEQKK